MDELPEGSIEGMDLSAEFLSDMAWTASMGRSHLPFRATIVFDSIPSLRVGLQDLIQRSGVDPIPNSSPQVAFMCGDQKPYSAKGFDELLGILPQISDFLDHLDEILLKTCHTSRSELFSIESSSQPVTHFVTQTCLHELWKNIEIQPSFVIGKGVGMIVSTYLAGIISLKTGLQIALEYGEAIDSDKNDSETLKKRLTTLLRSSEWPMAKMHLLNFCGNDLIWVKSGQSIDQNQWIDQFITACTASTDLYSPLQDHDFDVIIDLDPAGVTSETATASRPESGESSPSNLRGNGPLIIAGMKTDSEQDQDARKRFLRAIGVAYEVGVKVEFSNLFTREKHSRISLPLYPFQRLPFWVN